MATSPLGTTLRTARNARGWSRATLARQSGTSEPTISRTELYGSRPRLSTLMAWADALGLSLGDLLAGEDAAIPACMCDAPDLDDLGACTSCKRRPLDLLRVARASQRAT